MATTVMNVGFALPHEVEHNGRTKKTLWFTGVVSGKVSISKKDGQAKLIIDPVKLFSKVFKFEMPKGTKILYDVPAPPLAQRT